MSIKLLKVEGHQEVELHEVNKLYFTVNYKSKVIGYVAKYPDNSWKAIEGTHNNWKVVSSGKDMSDAALYFINNIKKKENRPQYVKYHQADLQEEKPDKGNA